MSRRAAALVALLALIGSACELIDGEPVSSLDLATGFQYDEYYIDVPAGTDNLVFTTTAASGDANLYVRYDQLPTTTTFDCSSTSIGSDEQCVITSPTPGRWYGLVDVVAAVDDFEIRADLLGAAAAAIDITANGSLNATSHANKSFAIENVGPVPITSVSFDLRTALVNDLVFDPVGVAGDIVAGCLEVQTGASATGFVAPGDACADPYSSPHEDAPGVPGAGFDVMTLDFTDFDPGEVIEFKTDIDPASIRGSLPAPEGGVSGLELSGTTVTVTDANAIVSTSTPFAIAGSNGGAHAAPIVDQTTPVLTVPAAAPLSTGLANGATGYVVTGTTAGLRVDAPEGSDVRVVVVGGDQHGGYDADGYETDNVASVAHYSGVADASGGVDLVVSLPPQDIAYAMAIVETPLSASVTSNAVAIVDAVPDLPPFLTPIDDQVLMAGSGTVNVAFSASDPEATPVGLSTENFPAFASISFNSQTGLGTVVLDTDAATPGAYPYMTVVATDAGGQQSSVVFDTAVIVEDSGSVLYRVNAGGYTLGALDSGPDWIADSATSPLLAPPVGHTPAGFTSSPPTSDLDPSVPSATPLEVFHSERWSSSTSTFSWQFPVVAGTSAEVRLYWANGSNNTSAVGDRVFDVEIDGVLVADDVDLVAQYGHQTGAMMAFPISSDGTVDIDFVPGVNSPLVNAIEIVDVGTVPDSLGVSANSVDFGSIAVGATGSSSVTVQNLGAAGAGDITISAVTPSGGEFSTSFVAPTTLTPGQTAVVPLSFGPTSAGAQSGSLTIVHDGVNSPTVVTLMGSGADAIGGVLYRVNAGGQHVGASDGGPDWTADSGVAPLLGPPVGHNGVSLVDAYSINSVDASAPASTPIAIYQTERYDKVAGAEMSWQFPVPTGIGVEVRLYMANGFFGTKNPGDRLFDVAIDGSVAATGIDPVALYGHKVGGMMSFPVTSDGIVDIEFLHDVQNPLVNAIEIVQVAGVTSVLSGAPSLLSFGQQAVGTSQTESISLSNVGAGGDPSIVVSGATVVGTGFSTTFTGPVSLVPGATVQVPITFDPASAGAASGTVTIDHDGTNDPLVLHVAGEAIAAGSIGFTSAPLTGAIIDNPTSLQWGPDGRLYVSQQDGTIYAYTVSRNAPGDYAVTATETIDLVKTIPNHNDDGSPATGVTDRQVTGILVAGTLTNPVLYVSSSDPRIAVGNTSPPSQSLDTNSGVVSRLTKSGGNWTQQILVEGLARSEENHSVNGMQLDGDTLYLVVGGNTNKGAPSNNFSQLPEYATATAILTIDLAAIGAGTYTVPTLGRAAGAAPWGGNDGATQGMLEIGSPVQVFSGGWRNAYDLVITEAGDLWTTDNGPNGGWGGPPIACTQASNEADAYTTWDNLHLVTAGYYGGHPNPTRAGATAAGWPGSPVPVALQDSAECDYFPSEGPGNAGTDGALAIFESSTNGMAEYTASNFGSQMAGDLLLASFDGTVYRAKPDGAGGLVQLGATEPEEALLSGFGSQPLDVTAVGDSGLFPGTIWAATYGSSDVTVFEPLDYDGSAVGCTGADDPLLDEDLDGFDNADEVANGTNPCSAGSQPDDWDGDKTSDLIDTDDDDDGVLDVVDAFALDPQNGLTTTLPLDYRINNGEFPNTFAGVGFTGWMLDPSGTTDYLDQFDLGTLTVGGASGVFTIDDVTEGDATGSVNDQDGGFQFGVAPYASTFTTRAKVEQPFAAGFTPTDDQATGVFLGTGDQDNFVSLQAIANGGAGGLEFAIEQGGVHTVVATVTDGAVLGDAVEVHLFLEVDPVTGLVRAFYQFDGAPGAPTLIGTTTAPTGWFDGPEAFAVGLLATSVNSSVFGTGAPFVAQWDEVELTEGNIDDAVAGETVLWRVNAGGPAVAAIDGGPDWLEDSSTNQLLLPAPGHNLGTNVTVGTNNSVNASVPASTPASVFDSQRYDPPSGAEMMWEFAAPLGAQVEVRVYFANIFNGTQNPGSRIFDVTVDNVIWLDDLDVSAQYGHKVGAMESLVITSDGIVDIDFVHLVENPMVSAIEIVELP